MVNHLSLEDVYFADCFAGTVTIRCIRKSHMLALLHILPRYTTPGIRTGVDSLALH